MFWTEKMLAAAFRADFRWLCLEQKSRCQTVGKVLLLLRQHRNNRTWHTVFLIHFSMIKVDATIDSTQQWFHDIKGRHGYRLTHVKHLACTQSISQTRGNKLKYNTWFHDGFWNISTTFNLLSFFLIVVFFCDRKNKDNKKRLILQRDIFSQLS